MCYGIFLISTELIVFLFYFYSVQGFSFYDISYMWYGFIGFMLTLLIGIIASLVSKKLMPIDGMSFNSYFEL